jgi:hypothetical protein
MEGYMYRATQTQGKNREKSKPGVGFEPTVPVFEPAKMLHASCHEASWIG